MSKKVHLHTEVVFNEVPSLQNLCIDKIIRRVKRCTGTSANVRSLSDVGVLPSLLVKSFFDPSRTVLQRKIYVYPIDPNPVSV